MSFSNQLDEILGKYPLAVASRMIKRNQDLYQWLKNAVPYRTDIISELIFLYQNPKFNPICERGNKRTYYQNGKYLEGCGGNCDCTKQKRREKIDQTNLKKYGVKNTWEIKEIQEKRKQTLLKKYGVEYPIQNLQIKEKIKKTNLERYGVENPKNSEKSKEKTKKTNLEKYGVEHHWQCPQIRSRILQTRLKAYGVEYPIQNLQIKEKIKKTNLERYGAENFNQKHIPKEHLEVLQNKEQFRILVEGKTIKQIQEKIKVDYNTIEKYIKNHNFLDLIKKYSSHLEDQIEFFCKTNNIKFIRNTGKIISPLQLDFYFPQVNAAIECHGLYWHSELAGKKIKDYHWNKWKLCKEKGVDLYQYFEDEINDKFEVIKSKILYLNNKHSGSVIGARRLNIDFLKNYSDEVNFYQTNHIQGPRPDRTHAIGAWLDLFNLVAVMSVKQTKPNQIEIVRFATDISNRYPGVFSKMLNWYAKQTNFKGEVVSWSDNRHSNGHLYKSNGFEFVREQKPGYFVTDYTTRWRREHFMKNKIKQRHPEVDLTKTEWRLEQELGLDRIWDAGKIFWKKSL